MTDESTGDLLASTEETTEAPVTETVEPQPAEEAGNEIAADLLSDDESSGNEGVPEVYTFEAPEGVEIDDDTKGRIEAFSEQAREMGLSQDQYQSLIQYDLDRAQRVTSEVIDNYGNRVQGWIKSASEDKEIGGEAFKANVARAQAMVKQFGDADLTSMMRSPTPENPDGLAVGNHPAMLRFLNRVGNAFADPTLLTGDAAPENEGTLQRMYPSMFNKSA